MSLKLFPLYSLLYCSWSTPKLPSLNRKVQFSWFYVFPAEKVESPHGPLNVYHITYHEHINQSARCLRHRKQRFGILPPKRNIQTENALTDLKPWSFREEVESCQGLLNMIHDTYPEILNPNLTCLRHLETFSDSHVNCRTSQVRQNTFDVLRGWITSNFSECPSNIMTLIIHTSLTSLRAHINHSRCRGSSKTKSSVKLCQ